MAFVAYLHEHPDFCGKGQHLTRRPNSSDVLRKSAERYEPLTLLSAKTSGNKKATPFNSDPNVEHF